MVGGPIDALEKARPALQAMGNKITHVGESGAGQIAKAANQIMVAAQMVAMGVLLIFAKKTGADPKKVIEAIRAGSAQCWTLDMKPPRLFSGNRQPGCPGISSRSSGVEDPIQQPGAQPGQEIPRRPDWKGKLRG